MGYTTEEGSVRLDFFKPSGKWYATEAIDMSSGYHKPSMHGALKEAINRDLYMPRSGNLRYGGMTVVCLEPYHKHAHPVMLTLPETGLFVLNEFDAAPAEGTAASSNKEDDDKPIRRCWFCDFSASMLTQYSKNIWLCARCEVGLEDGEFELPDEDE